MALAAFRPLCSFPKALRGPEQLGPRLRLQCQAQSQDLQQAAQSVEKVRLGQSDVFVSPLGVGAWSWGDTSYWHGTWDEGDLRNAKEAFNTSLDEDLIFFDTAEVYGSKLMSPIGGETSEGIIGRFINELPEEKRAKVVIATKFGAFPWRLTGGSVVSALKGSLERLQVSSIGLYQLHWPGIWANEAYLDGLADAVELGLVKAVGVSNYKEDRLRQAHAQLKKRGVQLASNQVHYSLIYRQPEKNGVKRACEELGVTLIAYSPIAQGVLSGKYTPSNTPRGARGAIYNSSFLARLEPVLNKLKEIGQRYDKTPTQVALNWLLAQKNVVPIPGAKTAAQAREFSGALGWALSDDEVAELRQIAEDGPSTVGFPAEYL